MEQCGIKLLKINWLLLYHIFFWVGYCTALWGAFEMAYQSPSDPIWSGTFGFPFPHHYIIGFVVLAILFILVTREDYISVCNKIKKVKVW